jgi:tetratricopeptide (TPR) repeat protein
MTPPRTRSVAPLVLPVLVSLVLFAPARALAQHEHEHEHAHEATEVFGKVHFPISCRPELQPSFDRAVALLHSFAYAEAEKAFADVAVKDPGCAMAQWGIAMSHFHVIWGPPTTEEFAAGKAAAHQAAFLAATGTTPRERDFVGAIGAYYAGDGVPHADRVVAFDEAMAGAAERNPDDHEAAIFHALGILGVAYNSPSDKSYARQRRAAEILNRLLPLEPEHPGIAHYMIHAFDYPELAALALPAARAYSKIAPSAPHALHMPSHIFTRLGLWRESIASNLASEHAAREWAGRLHPGAISFEGLHAMDYLEYAYLQTGQDAEAGGLVDSVLRAARFDAPVFQAGYALAAIQARYALERRDWKRAAAIEVAPANFPWSQYPYAEAIIHFARAVGAARKGDLPAARQAVAKLEVIRDGLKGQKGFDWATQVEVQRRAASAWLARAQKQDVSALALMRSAADLEDSTDKHPVTPGSVLPAREQLADLLLELGKPDAALIEYEASLRSAPARFNTYSGAARAAERSGDTRKAKEFHERLLAMCGGALPERRATR